MILMRTLIHARAASNFHLPESGYITLLGTGGRTVEKVVKYDLQSAHKYKPDIVILELGTNDLSTHAPEVVGSKIDDHMHALRHTYTTFGLLGCARL
jgi:lysophospholipase L1-like esterase